MSDMRMRTAVAAGATGLLAATGAAVGFQQMAPAAQPEASAEDAYEIGARILRWMGRLRDLLVARGELVAKVD